MTPNPNDHPHPALEPEPASQLFLLRVWIPAGAPDDGEAWHGRVQHTTTGETHAFRSCAELRRAVQQMMSRHRSSTPLP